MKSEIKNIKINISDDRLKMLLLEQLKIMPNIQINETEPCDMLIDDSLIKSEIGVPVRLGKFSDWLKYNLSGRTRLVEDEVIYDLGAFLLMADRNILKHKTSETEIRLTDKERLLLRSLYDAQDHKITRDRLLEDVWGYIKGTETHTLETHLYRLRQKLEQFNEPDFILSDGQGAYFLKIE